MHITICFFSVPTGSNQNEARNKISSEITKTYQTLYFHRHHHQRFQPIVADRKLYQLPFHLPLEIRTHRYYILRRQKKSKVGVQRTSVNQKVQPLTRSGQSSGAFLTNQGLHFWKSGPNSQYSAGRLQIGQQRTRKGWGFSAIKLFRSR